MNVILLGSEAEKTTLVVVIIGCCGVAEDVEIIGSSIFSFLVAVVVTLVLEVLDAEGSIDPIGLWGKIPPVVTDDEVVASTVLPDDCASGLFVDDVGETCSVGVVEEVLVSGVSSSTTDSFTFCSMVG